jgi:hypothetical protein
MTAMSRDHQIHFFPAGVKAVKKRLQVLFTEKAAWKQRLKAKGQ